MKKIKIPSKCKKCKCARSYDSGPYARNPHTCCELMWVLFEEDYRVDPGTRDENCPLEKIAEGKIKLEMEDDE